MDSPQFHHKQSSHRRLESNPSEGSSISSEFEPVTRKKYLPQLGGRHRTSTARSKSILIQRAPPTTMSEEEMFMKSEYDWLTWRMYHRIMDYREKHPINYIVLDESIPRNVTPTEEHATNHQSYPHSDQDTSAILGTFEDDEIFELDM